MNRFLIGGRVLKTALAVTLAIVIAQHLDMERATLAAIVALLTVQKTFYHSLMQSFAKLGSVLLGGVLGTAFSLIFGVSPLAYGLATLFAIYICLRLHWQEHIVLTAITAVTVIFSSHEMPLIFSLQQILTALLGAVCGLAVNYLFTPNHKREVYEKLREVEAGLRRAIDFIMLEMLEPGCDEDEFNKEVGRLKTSIEEGLDLAKLFQEEQRFVIHRETDSERYRRTFEIFKSQLDRLEEMHNLARRIPVKVPHAAPIVQMFRIVQRMQYRRAEGRHHHYKLVNRLMKRLEQSFEEMEMPGSRDEFISRASLFHLFQEVKRYYRRMQEMPFAVLEKA